MENVYSGILPNMKYLFIICLLLFTSINLYSQPRSENDSCICKATTYLKVPLNYGDDEVFGTVIVEFGIDTNCICSNPQVIKSVSKGLDEVALKVIANTILQLNKCRLKCLHNKCKPEKLKQPITFCASEDD